MSKAEELSYQLVLEKARENKDEKAVKQLLEIGKPPWSTLKHDRVHQKYVEKFGGGMSHDGKLVNTVIKKILLSKENTFLDLLRFVKGQYFSMTAMLEEMRRLDLSETIQSLKVPITFMMGRYDLTVPHEPTKAFFDLLDSNEKKWIWFEHSAHSPLFEENEKFVEEVILTARHDK